MSWQATKIYQKSRSMANKGRGLEELLIRQNSLYAARKIANIQKISTPWKVIRSGSEIVSAFPDGKSTLDFRGTVCGGIPVSFDAKESCDERGLPLKHLALHQVEYIREANGLGEISFIVCQIKPTNSFYVIDGEIVVGHWDLWKENKGRRGYNLISIAAMRQIERTDGRNILDYLSVALDVNWRKCREEGCDERRKQ